MRVRLQKYLAEAGVASRRHCEQLIEEGRVSVNGQPVRLLGTKVDEECDSVAVDGQPVVVERKVYIALNKPPGFLCTNHDTHQRKRAVDLLPHTLPRLYTVGRLDKDTEGLLLLTNDGTFSLRLTHPRYKMSKTYLVEVEGKLTSAEIARLLQGVRSDGEMLHAEKIFQVRPQTNTTELRIVLSEGKKRQIRRMMAAVGHPVKRLVRLAVGPVKLGNLATSQWRHLTHEEVCKLMQFSPAAFRS
ncbi:MAG TPA: pseudouridine synthase [Verrucomicrobiae bacterium]|nr:pseudouridine synthase [Verrucomicrobiae bacterium]